jgi:exodeoxyribonuclease VII large subunit
MAILSTLPALRLSELTAAIADTLAKAFGQRSFWVIADVTNHTFKPDKNYHHFDLVEKAADSNDLLAKVQAKAWGKGALSIQQFQQDTGQRFTNNIQVLVNVAVNYHPVFGLQLNINEIDPNFTLGMLEQQRLATLQRLVQENPGFISRVGDVFVTKNKELRLNKVIQRIAVVSSNTSAGWQDFKHTLDHNPFGYVFSIDDYFTLVQGENNAQQLVSRLIQVFESQAPYDAVVIIRGGGAQTDFLIFDNYLIGKAIAKFPIPIITGIGHQKNETIADLMAHTVTKTPTKAAEFILNHNRSFEDSIGAFQKRIIIQSQQRLSASLQAIGRLNSSIVNQAQAILFGKGRELLSVASAISTKPTIIVYNRKNDISQIVSNLAAFSTISLKNQRGYLGHYVTLIKALSPESTLKRGFAIIKTDNRITSDPDELVKGRDVEIILRNQSITTTVKSKKEYHGNEFNL